MILKENFKLIKDTPNLLNISSNIISTYEKEENDQRNVFVFLKQREKSIKNHFTKKTIYNLIEDINKRKDIRVVNFENYMLPVSYSPPSKSMIINLKPIDVEEITELSPNNLYALLVYTYCFRALAAKKVKIPETYAQPIVDFFLSLYIKVFGKEYGLLGIYATTIPMLKYLVACCVLSSFFGYKNDKKLYRKASALAPYNFKDDIDQLKKYDFSDITYFIKSLSDFKVMPGIRVYGFTAKLHRFLGLTFLPALEDLSRFISILLTSNIKGSNIVRSFLYTYNEKAFNKILEIAKKVFR